MDAEDEGKARVIIESSLGFTETQAVFRRAAMAGDIEGHATQQGEVRGEMVFAGAVSILAENAKN